MKSSMRPNVSSMLCYNFELEKNRQKHRQNLQNIKSVVPPIKQRSISVEKQQFSYLYNNKKREYLNEIRFTEIARENNVLLNKISTIQSSKKNNKTKNQEVRILKQGSKNYYRQQKSVSIHLENQRLLKRIMNKKSNYDIHSQNEEFVQNRQYFNNINQVNKINNNVDVSFQRDKISSYIGSRPATTTNYNSTGTNFRNRSTNGFQQQQQISQQKGSTKISFYPNNSRHQRSNSTYAQRKYINKITQNRVLIQKQKIINDSEYNIEVKLDQGNMLIIADQINGYETKIIEIPENEAFEFLRFECQNNYDILLQKIHIQNGKLSLKGTVQSQQQIKDLQVTDIRLDTQEENILNSYIPQDSKNYNSISKPTENDYIYKFTNEEQEQNIQSSNIVNNKDTNIQQEQQQQVVKQQQDSQIQQQVEKQQEQQQDQEKIDLINQKDQQQNIQQTKNSELQNSEKIDDFQKQQIQNLKEQQLQKTQINLNEQNQESFKQQQQKQSDYDQQINQSQNNNIQNVNDQNNKQSLQNSIQDSQQIQQQKLIQNDNNSQQLKDGQKENIQIQKPQNYNQEIKLSNDIKLDNENYYFDEINQEKLQKQI